MTWMSKDVGFERIRIYPVQYDWTTPARFWTVLQSNFGLKQTLTIQKQTTFGLILVFMIQKKDSPDSGTIQKTCAFMGFLPVFLR